MIYERFYSDQGEIINAFEFTGNNVEELDEFSDGKLIRNNDGSPVKCCNTFYLKSGLLMPFIPGDYIVKFSGGGFRAFNHDEFHQMYRAKV